MNSFKGLQKVISLIISLLMLASLLGGCQDSKKESSAPESLSSESSSSSKEESFAPESLPPDVALKYKDSVMSLKEYIAIFVELSVDGSLRGDMSQFKEKSIETAKSILLVREKLRQAGKDLPEERKKSARDSLYENLYDGAAGSLHRDKKSLTQSEKEKILKTCKKILEAAGSSMEAFEEAAEDAQRQEFGILEEHIEIKKAEYDDVIVNYDAINKVDTFNFAEIISN